MSFNRYYQEELGFLRQLAGEFAQANPNLVQFLGRDSTDPDVHRLMEAFAFVAGRLREKIDDELPELSHSMFGVMFPHYLRPIPPLSVLEFAARPNALTAPRLVPAGAVVETGPIDGTRCRFRTAFDVTVRPLAIRSIRLHSTHSGSQLTVTLATTGDVPLSALELSNLTLYLRSGGVPAASRTLFLYLTRYLRACSVKVGGDVLARLGQHQVTPSASATPLLDYPRNAFAGFRTIQEYFALPARFMFVDVAGLGAIARTTAQSFDLAFEFDRPMQGDVRPEDDTIRLNATPIINAFPMDGEPITVDQRKTEYRVRASGRNAHHYGIVSVDDVTGWGQGHGVRLRYPHFETFRHSARPAGDEGQPATAQGTYVRVRRQPAMLGEGVDTYLAFVRSANEPVTPPTEVASLALTCTNGPLADRLGIGSVTEATGDTPPEISFRNIEAVSAEVPPPLRGDLLWRLVTNLSLNFASLAEPETIRAVIGAYDFGALVDEQRRHRRDRILESIRAVRQSPTTILVRGVSARGTQIQIDVKESQLGGVAEAYLFGAVMDAFFAAYASINTCHQFELNCIDSNTRFQWPIRSGQKMVI